MLWILYGISAKSQVNENYPPHILDVGWATGQKWAFGIWQDKLAVVNTAAQQAWLQSRKHKRHQMKATLSYSPGWAVPSDWIYSKMLAMKDTNLRDLRADDVISSWWAVQYSLENMDVMKECTIFLQIVIRWYIGHYSQSETYVQKLHRYLGRLHMCLNWFSGHSIKIMQMSCVEFMPPKLLEFSCIDVSEMGFSIDHQP